MDIEFESITGPHQSKRENFEELVSQLIILEIGSAQPVDGAGGDEGIDCFRRASDGALDVFQAKFFLGRLTSAQKKQVERSLAKVMERHSLRQWVLCIPLNPTPAELRWFKGLAPPGVTVEWWGASQLRALLSKHDALTNQFFARDRLEQQFDAFRREVVRYLQVEQSALHPYGREAGPVVRPSAYLARVTRISGLLVDDAQLVVGSVSPRIVVDFSEIYSYLVIDDRLTLVRPVVDFCVAESPFPLEVLHPHVLELNQFLRQVTTRSYTLADQVRTPGEESYLSEFVRAFEQSPDSPEALRTFASIQRLLQNFSPGIVLGLRKLQNALASGRIHFATGDIDPEFISDETTEIVKAFRLRRPHANFSTFLDACALALVRNVWSETSHGIRLVSSAPTMARVAESVLGHRHPIRTASQYAYFIHAHRRPPGNQAGDIHKLGVHLAEASSRVAPFANHALPMNSEVTKRRALEAFGEFVPLYRDFLKPVDEMIISGARAPGRHAFGSMAELYHCLIKEAELLDGFRTWLANVCEAIAAFSASTRLDAQEQAFVEFEEKFTDGW
jgi:hypothetical protein